MSAMYYKIGGSYGITSFVSDIFCTQGGTYSFFFCFRCFKEWFVAQ